MAARLPQLRGVVVPAATSPEQHLEGVFGPLGVRQEHRMLAAAVRAVELVAWMKTTRHAAHYD